VDGAQGRSPLRARRMGVSREPRRG
jgi:hypothetical protein